MNSTADSETNPDSTKGIWQRLPQETPDAFSAFSNYLDLGADAGLTEVAEKTGKSHGAIKNLSWRHNWLERAAAFRQHLASITLASLEGHTIQNRKLWSIRQQINRERRWERMQKLDLLCDQALGKLVSDPETSVAPYELAALLRLASDSAEKVTAHADAEQEVKSFDTDPIVLEFRAHIEKACEDKLKRDAQSQPPPQPAPAPPPPPEAAPSPRAFPLGSIPSPGGEGQGGQRAHTWVTL